MTDRGRLICDALKQNGVRFIVWLPDSESHFMHEAMLHDTTLRVVQVCGEGEAIAIATGLHLGGQRPIVLIENQGLYDAGNALKMAVDHSFPIVLMVGYLMYRQLVDSPRGKVWRNATWDGTRDMTEPFIKAYELPSHIVDSDADVQKIGEAFAEAERSCKPVVVLLTSADLFAPGMAEVR